jgi:hypothetical protein
LHRLQRKKRARSRRLVVQMDFNKKRYRA